MRAPDVAAGEFLELLMNLFTVTGASLLLILPTDISSAERKILIEEYDSGASHLSFYFTMKLTHMTEFPWKVFVLGHRDVQTAYDGMREALASDCQHPRIRNLQAEPLRTEALQWLEEL